MSDDFVDYDVAEDTVSSERPVQLEVPHSDAIEGFEQQPEASEPASVTQGDEPGIAGATTSDGDTIHYSVKQMKAAREVLTRLHAVRRAARFYPMEHPAVTECVVLLGDAVRVYHDEGVDVQLAFFEGEILLGSQLLAEESMLFDQLVREMTALGVGSLILECGMSGEDLVSAVRVMSLDADEMRAAGGVETVAAEAHLSHVRIGAVGSLQSAMVAHEAGVPTDSANVAFSNAVSMMREIDRLLDTGRHVSSTKVKGVVRSLVDNVLANRYAMLQLTGLKNYDEYTFYHSANVAILSLALGSCISEDYRFLSSLGVGALLHDVGKLTIPLDVLNKPGALTPEEWTEVRQHPITGAEMIAQLPGVDKSAVVIILEHHMRWDGTGYPSRTPRRRQNLCARIVAVADSYDAMTSRRSYSAARVQDDAMLTLAQSAGSSLDPVLVRSFITLMGIYPPRSVVRLSDGAVAIVLSPSDGDPLRPMVRRIAAPDGELLTPEDIDLVHVPDLSISGCLDARLLNVEVDDFI